MSSKLPYQLVIDRSAFFANRVDTYARALGLNNQQVIDRLCALALIEGKDKITGIIDLHVPEHLHSSKMPQ